MSNRTFELRPLSKSAADKVLEVLAMIPSAPARAASASQLARSEGERRFAGAKRLNQSAAILAFSVLADSAIEHYRGSFQNKAMYAPIVASALTLAVSAAGARRPSRDRHIAREAVYASAIGIGAAGLGFHLYNILKRPGRLSWLNLFYAAPIGAPGALALAALMGHGAESAAEGGRRPFLGTTLGRSLARLAAVGIAGAVGEAGLLHFRGAFQNPAMFLPVSIPPVAAALLADAAARPARSHRAARWWLRLTALLGAAGAGFHVFGISRAMGGWRNWSQNVLNGPPLPAPPSFTGLALAGLAALALIEEAGDG